MDRPTFSQSWSRVSRLTPMLTPHAQAHRQLFRGQPWHVVHDPLSNQFFRLNPVAYHFVGLLDGKRTVDEVWNLTLERFGDAAPTQNEVIGLLGQLNESNLLRVDMPPDAEPLLRRNRQRRLRHWGGQAMSILFLRFPLFNPDRILTWLTPLFRPLLSKGGLLLWLVWLLFIGWQFAPHIRDFTSLAQQHAFNPSNWAWLAALFVIIKVCHELGHGLVCKRFGGVVPEVGIMMLVLFPFPYVDATSSWNFPKKSHRILVAAAGMLFELAIAGVAALVWIQTDRESLVSQLAYQVVFMASIATILFNANPLLRFDGYYILADFFEVPNLYERAKKHMQYLVQRYAYGMTRAQPVTTRLGERVILTLYGIASQIYRVLILGGIIMVIAGKLFTLGLLLAAWSIIAWVLVPFGKFVHWLATGPALHEHRARAVGVTVAFFALVLGLVGAVPVRDHRRAVGVVESAQRTELAIKSDGFIREVLVESGQFVRSGEVILKAQNPDLQAQYDKRRAELKELHSTYRQAIAEDQVDIKTARARISAVNDVLSELEDQLKNLELRSPQDGTVISSGLKQLLGQYVSRGQVIAKIVDMNQLRVTSLVDQKQNAALFDEANRIEKVQIRTAGSMSEVLPSQLIRRFDSGRSRLPHPALGYQGGGSIATKVDDPQGQTAQRPQFELWLSLPHSSWRPDHSLADDQGTPRLKPNIVDAYPGQRVHVRFTLERRRPWLVQWYHMLRQLFRDQLLL